MFFIGGVDICTAHIPSKARLAPPSHGVYKEDPAHFSDPKNG